MDTPLARKVGDAFEEQYYLVMKEYPEKLDKFYKDNSTITRPRNDGTMRSFSLLDIGESLNPLSSGGFDSVVVTSIISHNCTGACVMVTVTGYFISNETVEKNFIQTFLLAIQDAPQDAPEEKKHFVLTDLLVFLDKPEAGTKVDSKASIPPADNETEVTRSEVAGDDDLKDVPNLSFASAVMKETPKTQTHRSSCDQSPRREAEAVDDRGDNNNGDWHGIVIKNLHPNTTNTTVRYAFEQFGEIARILNRSPRVVLFIEEDAVRKAKQASPMMIEGRQVTVEDLIPKWGIIR